jgi:hypothetical protein
LTPIVSPVSPGTFDVTILRAFVSTAQQDYDLFTATTEVHPVTGTKVDTKFIHTVPDRAGIPKIAEANPSNALTDTVAGGSITKPSQPLGKRLAAIRTGVDVNFLLDRHVGRVA